MNMKGQVNWLTAAVDFGLVRPQPVVRGGRFGRPAKPPVPPTAPEKG